MLKVVQEKGTGTDAAKGRQLVILDKVSRGGLREKNGDASSKCQRGGPFHHMSSRWQHPPIRGAAQAGPLLSPRGLVPREACLSLTLWEAGLPSPSNSA